jgi:asparagine synthase (glutamine-hydrolysing)
MCGIAGIYHQAANGAVDRERIVSMISTMPHRGPDARGATVYPGVGLGHVRLSILDLTAEANQPFESDDGRLSITYNGEIFNFVELRSELEALGHRFRTHCDTEVLIHAYQEWGADSVQRLNGMWAFAIYDHERDELFCSRDRFGIKPFTYAFSKGRFVFSSEAKALLDLDRDLARPDYSTLRTILRSPTGYRMENTCFEEIKRLPPAHNLIVRRDGHTIERYWDYPTHTDDAIEFADASEQLRELLEDSVRIRMRSDVPVGSTLSSGVDSSAVVTMVRSIYNGHHDTFTASYPGEDFDESKRAEELSRSLHMTPHAVPAIPDDFLGDLSRCVSHLEGPIRSPAVLPLFRIHELARTRVTVVLEGQGADELLAGYPEPCLMPAIRDRLRRGRYADAIREINWQRKTIGLRTVVLFGGRALVPGALEAYAHFRGDGPVFAGPLREATPNPPGRDAPPMNDVLNEVLRNQHERGLVNLLHYGDAISMAHSLESRLPFMDYRLVEFAFRLPGHMKFRNGYGKSVLRSAVDGLVPPDILWKRSKLAFRTPVKRWFREQAEQTVYPVLKSEACRKRGIFDPIALDRAIERHRSGKVDLSHIIYRWLMTELWFQRFID